MRRLTLLAAMSACASHPPPVVPASGCAPLVEGEDTPVRPAIDEARTTMRASPIVALLRVTQVEHEPSDMGGEYLVFEIVRIGRGPTVIRAGWGAHGKYASCRVGAYFIAGLRPLGGLRRWKGDPRWEIRELPDIDASIVAAIGVTSRDEGEQQLLGL